MTRYNYLTEMQDLCFRATMALSVIGDDGMKDFYLAANEGFFNQLAKMPVEEAKQNINQSQIEQYLTTKEFVETKEKEAAEFIKKTTEEAEKKKKVIPDDDQEYKEIFADNQAAEDYIDKAFTDDNFLQTVAADAREQEEAMLHQDPKGGEKKALF